MAKLPLNGWTKYIAAIIALIGLYIVAARGLMSYGVERKQIQINTQINAEQDTDINCLKTELAVIKKTTGDTAEDVKDLGLDIKSLLKRTH